MVSGQVFGRVITAMVTPFDDQGRVNFGRAVLLAKHLLSHGSDSLVISGTTGESPTLTQQERLMLFSAVKEDAGGVVIAGSTNNCTDASIWQTREAQALGVDGILMVVPYYNNPPQEGLYRHFRAIAESTSLPCLLYNVPSRTVRNLDADTVIRLAQDVPNIVGIKEASGDLNQIDAIIKWARDNRPDFLVWSGNDQDTYVVVNLGGYGVISVASHLVGKEIKKMVEAIVNGSEREAWDWHVCLLPLANALFPPISPVASPAAVKAALNLLGFKVGGLRLPLIELPKAAQEDLKKLLLTQYELVAA